MYLPSSCGYFQEPGFVGLTVRVQNPLTAHDEMPGLEREREDREREIEDMISEEREHKRW